MATQKTKSHPSEKWLVVLTFGQADWQAYTGLLRRGVRSMMPYTLGDARRGRWAHGVVKPQYPGYLFAALEGDVTTEAIKNVPGVRDLLMDRGGLIFVSPAEVASCKARWLADYRAAAPRLIRKPVIAIGDWLAVPHGPFAGLPCQVTALDKSGNVCASVGPLQLNFRAQDVHDAVRARAKLARKAPKHAKAPV